jgi:hypothetical protein
MRGSPSARKGMDFARGYRNRPNSSAVSAHAHSDHAPRTRRNPAIRAGRNRPTARTRARPAKGVREQANSPSALSRRHAGPRGVRAAPPIPTTPTCGATTWIRRTSPRPHACVQVPMASLTAEWALPPRQWRRSNSNGTASRSLPKYCRYGAGPIESRGCCCAPMRRHSTGGRTRFHHPTTWIPTKP